MVAWSRKPAPFTELESRWRATVFTWWRKFPLMRQSRGRRRPGMACPRRTFLARHLLAHRRRCIKPPSGLVAPPSHQAHYVPACSRAWQSLHALSPRLDTRKRRTLPTMACTRRALLSFSSFFILASSFLSLSSHWWHCLSLYGLTVLVGRFNFFLSSICSFLFFPFSFYVLDHLILSTCEKQIKFWSMPAVFLGYDSHFSHSLRNRTLILHHPSLPW